MKSAFLVGHIRRIGQQHLPVDLRCDLRELFLERILLLRLEGPSAAPLGNLLQCLLAVGLGFPAAAAALTPAMQKGNDTARSLHIAFNSINVALFLWQVPTGLEIVEKVFQFTTLP